MADVARLIVSQSDRDTYLEVASVDDWVQLVISQGNERDLPDVVVRSLNLQETRKLHEFLSHHLAGLSR